MWCGFPRLANFSLATKAHRPFDLGPKFGPNLVKVPKANLFSQVLWASMALHKRRSLVLAFSSLEFRESDLSCTCGFLFFGGGGIFDHFSGDRVRLKRNGCSGLGVVTPS